MDLAEKRAGSGRLGGRITRQRFLGALSAGASGIALTGMLGCEPPSRTLASTAPGGPVQARAFRTRPELRPPYIKVNTGPGPDGLRPVASFPRAGFETIATLQAEGRYFTVKAEDDAGQELATSREIKPQDRASVPPNQKRGQES